MSYSFSVRAGVAALALTALAALGRSPAHAQNEGLPVGSKPPSFTVRTLKGQTIDPSKKLGKVVLLDFWATWCPPCRDSIPTLQALHSKYARQGLLVLGISNESTTTVTPFVTRNGMTYNVAADPSISAVAEKYKVDGIPTMILIDRKGVIRMYEVGFDPRPNGSKVTIESMVKKLLAEK